MKVLLVYELIPEDTKFYVFENVNPNSELLANLKLANGHYSNYNGETGDNDGTEFLNAYLEDQPLTPVADVPNAGPFDAVFHSGFGL